jgi:hypothetical protein
VILMKIMRGALAFLLLVSTAGVAAADSIRPGRIASAVGSVEVVRADGSAFAATQGVPVLPGQSIRTGPGASCVVALSRANMVRIGEGATVRMDELARRSPEGGGFGRSRLAYDLNLERGRVLASMRGLPGGSVTTVRTPIATAGVRGTVFLVAVEDRPGDEAGVEVTFAATEGAIEITGLSDEPIELEAGEAMTIEGVEDAEGEWEAEVEAPEDLEPGDLPEEVAEEFSEAGDEVLAEEFEEFLDEEGPAEEEFDADDTDDGEKTPPGDGVGNSPAA